jgi:serine protease Do
MNTAKPIIKQLIEKGSVARPYLGISGKTVDDKLSDLYELPLGVVVAQVAPDSGAADAGLQQGDVIIKLDDQRINSIEQLSEEINKRTVGAIVELTIVRNGDEKIIKEVELKNRNE